MFTPALNFVAYVSILFCTTACPNDFLSPNPVMQGAFSFNACASPSSEKSVGFPLYQCIEVIIASHGLGFAVSFALSLRLSIKSFAFTSFILLRIKSPSPTIVISAVLIFNGLISITSVFAMSYNSFRFKFLLIALCKRYDVL